MAGESLVVCVGHYCLHLARGFMNEMSLGKIAQLQTEVKGNREVVINLMNGRNPLIFLGTCIAKTTISPYEKCLERLKITSSTSRRWTFVCLESQLPEIHQRDGHGDPLRRKSCWPWRKSDKGFPRESRPRAVSRTFSTHKAESLYRVCPVTRSINGCLCLPVFPFFGWEFLLLLPYCCYTICILCVRVCVRERERGSELVHHNPFNS